jgi:hypothetical protein
MFSSTRIQSYSADAQPASAKVPIPRHALFALECPEHCPLLTNELWNSQSERGSRLTAKSLVPQNGIEKTTSTQTSLKAIKSVSSTNQFVDQVISTLKPRKLPANQDAFESNERT